MKFYLVRVQETREAVGFFWARDNAELCMLVDEIMNPDDAEAREIGVGGGIRWSGKVPYTFPHAPPKSPDDDDFSLDDIGLSEHLLHILIDRRKLRDDHWLPITEGR